MSDEAKYEEILENEILSSLRKVNDLSPKYAGKWLDVIAKECTKRIIMDLPDNWIEGELFTAQAEVIRLTGRNNILVEAMAEVKATNDGESEQPIKDIVEGCIDELAAMKGGK